MYSCRRLHSFTKRKSVPLIVPCMRTGCSGSVISTPVAAVAFFIVECAYSAGANAAQSRKQQLIVTVHWKINAGHAPLTNGEPAPGCLCCRVYNRTLTVNGDVALKVAVDWATVAEAIVSAGCGSRHIQLHNLLIVNAYCKTAGNTERTGKTGGRNSGRRWQYVWHVYRIAAGERFAAIVWKLFAIPLAAAAKKVHCIEFIKPAAGSLGNMVLGAGGNIDGLNSFTVLRQCSGNNKPCRYIYFDWWKRFCWQNLLTRREARRHKKECNLNRLADHPPHLHP